MLEYCKVRGWQPPMILRDAASGASSSRPGLEQMLAQVRAGGVHQVVTYKLDRLGRSLTHLAIIVGELQMRNVALICTSQGIDTSKQNPVGQLQLGVLMAVAEFERALIKERTLAGLEVARKKGKRLVVAEQCIQRGEIPRLRRHDETGISDVGSDERTCSRRHRDTSKRIMTRAASHAPAPVHGWTGAAPGNHSVCRSPRRPR